MSSVQHAPDGRPPRDSAGPEEQVWPVNVALLVLGGLVAGTIIATSSFDDPHIVANGYVRLAALGIMLGGLVWVASRLGNRRLRRAFQFAAVMSLILHLALILALASRRGLEPEKPVAEAEPKPEREFSVQMDYTTEAMDDPDAVNEFDKPVEVAPTDARETKAAREQPTTAPAPKQAAQPATAPTAIQTARPASVKEATRREAAPRRGNPSKLSRRPAEAKINPDNPPTQLPVVKNDDEPVAKLSPRDANLARRQAAAPGARPNTPGDVSVAARPRETNSPARRPSAQAAPEAPSIPLAKNRLNEPRELPRELEAPLLPKAGPSTAATARDDSPTGPKADTLARTRDATGPARSRMAELPDVGDTTARPDSPKAPAPSRDNDAPRMASTQRPGGLRAAPATIDSRANDAPAAEPSGAAAKSVAQDEAGPVATTLSRSRNDRLGSAPMPATAPSEPSPSPRSVAQNGPRRGQPSDRPTLNPSGRPAPRSSRATQAANVETSPIALDNTAIGSSSGGPDGSNSGPGPTALAKNEIGAAGPGANRSAAATAGALGDDLPISSPRASDGRAGASGIEHGPSRASGGGGGGGGPNAAPRVAGRSSGRSSAGGGPLLSLAADQIADAPRAPPGDGGGDYAAQPEAAGDGPGATRRGDSGSLPLGNRAIESPHTDGLGAGAGASSIARAAGSQAEGPGAGMSGAGSGGGGKTGSHSRGAGSGRGIGGARALADAGGIDGLADAPLGDEGGQPAGNMVGGGSPSGSGGGDRLAPVADASAGRGGAGGPGSAGPGALVGPPQRGSGIPGAPTDHLAGVAVGDAAIDSNQQGAPGNGLAPGRNPAVGDGAGPRVGVVALDGKLGPHNLAGMVAAADGVVLDIGGDLPAGGGQTDGKGGGDTPGTGPGGGLAELGPRTEMGVVGRRPGGLAVEVAAPEGPGGLGGALAADVGSADRLARRDSEIVHTGAGRFLGRKTGGVLSVDGRAREPARAFARRGGQRRNGGAGLSEPMQRTEDAVELGLDFLARHQMPEGNWSLERFGVGRPGYENEQSQFRSDTAATALALLSFLGAGYDHYDDQYQNTVRGGLEFLHRHQRPNGDLYIAEDAESNKSAWLYSHGMATIALCEAYGMTGDENLREPAQRAIDFIVASQHPTRGGWRYQPQHDSDTSVSGWQLMALKSGELSGLHVPPKTYDLARHWLDAAQAAGDHTEFVYNPYAPDTPQQRHGRRPTTTITAVGLLMRLYLGANREDPLMKRGAEHLAHHLPSLGTQQQPLGDTYYWYYATQVMFHMKGDNWTQWNQRLHPLLVDTQIKTGPKAGSWDPTADRWGKAAGRIYVTTMNLLSLEVYYRHLPIYESEAQ